MAQTNVNIRMDEELKKQFDSFCGEVGMTMTTLSAMIHILPMLYPAKSFSYVNYVMFLSVTSRQICNAVLYFCQKSGDFFTRISACRWSVLRGSQEKRCNILLK